MSHMRGFAFCLVLLASLGAWPLPLAAKPVGDKTLRFDAARSTDADLDLIVYEAYLAARKLAFANDNHFVSSTMTLHDLRAGIGAALAHFPGVVVRIDLERPRDTRNCAAPGQTVLNVFVTETGDGIAIAASNETRSSADHYDPAKPFELVEMPAHPCLMVNLPDARS